MLRLHYTPGSFFSRKVRITLAEKGLQYEPHVEGSSRDRSADAFSALNPALKVPALVDRIASRVIPVSGMPILAGLSRSNE